MSQSNLPSPFQNFMTNSVFPPKRKDLKLNFLNHHLRLAQKKLVQVQRVVVHQLEVVHLFECFDKIKKIGAGSFGQVSKARCKEDGKYYAIKEVIRKTSGQCTREHRYNEVEKLDKLPPHPNCVRFYKAWEENEMLFIQMELCHSNLCEYVTVMSNDIPEKIIWIFLVDLLQAVKHLHDHNLVHLDIKPDNILISKCKTMVKLGDFGLVLDLSVNSDKNYGVEGDQKYVAPEVMTGIYTKAADIFSLGITILELATDLDLPQDGVLWQHLRQLQFPEEFTKKISPNLVAIITLMMEPCYERRLSVDEILSLPCVDKVYQSRKELYKKFLDLDDEVSSPYLESLPIFDPLGLNSSINDDVFEKNSNSSRSSFSEKIDAFETNSNGSLNFSTKNNSDQGVLLDENSNSSLDACRSRLVMSTPSGFRYWDPKAFDTSGSPCLSGSRRKRPSSGEDSPCFKSPRTQLFLDDNSDEENEQSIRMPAKNLFEVFSLLSP